MKLKSKIKRKVEGITLIALVVTIIVLLILASVAISLTIGSNGIFTRAKDSVEEYEKKEKEEEVNMYWAEAQLNYEETIEEQVEYLQNKMREQDEKATAVINGEVIEVTYKGHSMKLNYIEEKIPYKIKYADSILLEDNKILNFYAAEDSKMYSELDGNTICITDKFNELKNEKDLKIIGTGNENEKQFIVFFTKKKVYSLIIPKNKTEEWSLEKNIDLKELENGKYKDKNISYCVFLGDEGSTIFFEDGIMYNVGTKEETYLENRIVNFGVVVQSGNIQIILIDENGQMNKMTENGLESINETFANGFFKDKRITMSMPVMIYNNQYIAFLTDDGEMYFTDRNANKIISLSDLNANFKEKKIINVFNIGLGQFEENYIVVISEEGKAYYVSQDLNDVININTNGFPELHIKLS